MELKVRDDDNDETSKNNFFLIPSSNSQLRKNGKKRDVYLHMEFLFSIKHMRGYHNTMKRERKICLEMSISCILTKELIHPHTICNMWIYLYDVKKSLLCFHSWDSIYGVSLLRNQKSFYFFQSGLSESFLQCKNQAHTLK